MFATAYYGMLRVGEISSGDHPILARDVHIAKNKQKLLLILQSSKTHWRNDKPQMVKISSEVNIAKKGKLNKHCPFHLLRIYASMRGPYTCVSEPFFIFMDKMPVKPFHVNAC